MLPAKIFRNGWESIPPRSKIEADGKQASPLHLTSSNRYLPRRRTPLMSSLKLDRYSDSSDRSLTPAPAYGQRQARCRIVDR